MEKVISPEVVKTSKKTLDWSDLRHFGRQDNAGRWWPKAQFSTYFSHLRRPSRQWPNSYSKSALTQKFARWVVDEFPDLAKVCGLVE